MKTYTADVKTDPVTGDQILQFSPEFIQDQDWRDGDTVDWNVDEGHVTMENLSKKERDTPVFLVETVSIFRMRYAVRCKSAQHAADTVIMQEAEEMSQKHVDECITSVRELSREEYLNVFDEDNDYLKEWSEDQKTRFIHCVKYDNL